VHDAVIKISEFLKCFRFFYVAIVTWCIVNVAALPKILKLSFKCGLIDLETAPLISSVFTNPILGRFWLISIFVKKK